MSKLTKVSRMNEQWVYALRGYTHTHTEYVTTCTSGLDPRRKGNANCSVVTPVILWFGTLLRRHFVSFGSFIFLTRKFTSCYSLLRGSLSIHYTNFILVRKNENVNYHHQVLYTIRTVFGKYDNGGFGYMQPGRLVLPPNGDCLFKQLFGWVWWDSPGWTSVQSNLGYYRFRPFSMV